MGEIYYLVVERPSIEHLYKNDHFYSNIAFVGATYSFRELRNWAVTAFGADPTAEINEIRGCILKGDWAVIELPTIH